MTPRTPGGEAEDVARVRWGADSEYGVLHGRAARAGRELPLAADERDLEGHPRERGEVRRRARPGAASRAGLRLRGGRGHDPLARARPRAPVPGVRPRLERHDAGRRRGHPARPAVAARRIRAGHPLLPGERNPDPGNDHRRFDRGRRRDDRRARRDADRQRRGAHQIQAARQLASWMEADGWEVRIEAIPGQFVHIDVLVSILAPKLAAVCVEAASGGLVALAARQGLRDPRGLARGRLRPRGQRDLARRRAGDLDRAARRV